MGNEPENESSHLLASNVKVNVLNCLHISLQLVAHYLSTSAFVINRGFPEMREFLSISVQMCVKLVLYMKTVFAGSESTEL